jgi:hypothetical protein
VNNREAKLTLAYASLIMAKLKKLSDAKFMDLTAKAYGSRITKGVQDAKSKFF